MRLPRKPRVHRGLTLVEVLISTVLMAMLASACLPLIARATRLLHETAASDHDQRPEIDLGELGGLADDLIADPKAFGFDELPMSGEFTVTWKDGPEQWPHVNVRILESVGDGSNVDHQWLEFRYIPEEGVGGPELKVYRWRHIELEDVAGKAPPPGGAR